FPSRKDILADLQALMARDWANIEAGIYRPPHDLLSGGLEALRGAPRFFREFSKVEELRLAGRHQEVFTPERRGRYPRYYLQNFHYQSGGWLSEESAAVYDHQVEVLFGGGSDAMRRQGLVPLQRFLAERRSRDCHLVDLGTGTARWLSFVKQNYPLLQVTGLDLSGPYLEKAAETWTGEWWKLGGGGTVWDSMAYDAELDLLYIGVGNGSPWNAQIRSPDGGDNLFLSSIVALRPDTGEYVWHYQETPRESWDFTATQHMILADIEVGGRQRKVIMQAPKNGFFYVLDRATGEFLSAEKYTLVTWASHVDPETGRPVEAPGMRYDGGQPAVTFPGFMGGHNWQPMSYSPLTGLVYIPAQQTLAVYAHDAEFSFRPGFYNTGIDWT
ncbi:MAG: hypothetical protein P8X52_11535, partial [Limibacillus sp.]